MTNPFNPRYPVDPKYFANREEILDNFKRDFAYSLNSKPPKPENIAVVGEWGIGKTSVLNKFSELTSKEKQVFPIFISLTTYSNMASFVKDLINKIHRAISESKTVSTKIKENIFSWRIRSLQLGPVSIEKEIKEFTGLSPSEQLRSSLIDLWQSHLGKEFRMVVLILDDFHHVVRIARESLYDIRAIFQGLPRHGCNYQLIISGSTNMFGEIRNLAEPLVRFFSKYKLDNFSYIKTKEAITLPLKLEKIPIRIDKSVVEAVHKLTNGHPFLIAFFMRDLIELRKKGKINSKFFDKNYSAIFEHLRKDKFEKDLDSVGENERKVLTSVSKLGNMFSPSEIKIRVKNVRMYLSSLVDKNLITKLSRGKYKLYHPLFKEYLRYLK